MKLRTTLLAACVLCLLCVGVLADNKEKMLKERVEFTSDVMIGDTMVKHGYYLVKYNEETGMMKVVDPAHKDRVIATAKATVRMNDKSYGKDEVLTKTVSGHEMLTALRLGGQKEEISLTDSMGSDVNKN